MASDLRRLTQDDMHLSAIQHGQRRLLQLNSLENQGKMTKGDRRERFLLGERMDAANDALGREWIEQTIKILCPEESKREGLLPFGDIFGVAYLVTGTIVCLAICMTLIVMLTSALGQLF